jgi:hypothetical protein
MVNGFTLFANAAMVICAWLIGRHAVTRARTVYPAGFSSWVVELSAWASTMCAMILLPLFWPVRLAVLGACAAYVVVAGRYLLLAHLRRRPMGTYKPLPVWQAFVAARHYLAHGEVNVSIGPFVGEYYSVVIRGRGEHLLAATVKRPQAFRLMQSLAAHYPAETRPPVGWATYSLRIDTMRRGEPARVEHTLGPISAIVTRPA